MDESSLGFYYRFEQRSAPPKDSPALRYGTLLHLWGELGPDTFWQRVAEAPAAAVTATGQLGKAAEDWLASLGPDAIPVSPADLAKLRPQTDQILANPKAKELLDASTEKTREFNVKFWWDKHACRCRVDGATQGMTPDCWFDLKTTSDIDPAKTFGSACANWRYDIQSAFYQRAARELGWAEHRLHFIATSTVYPHLCAVMVLPWSVLRQATARISDLLSELEQRRRLNWWTPREYGEVIEISPRYFNRGSRW